MSDETDAGAAGTGGVIDGEAAASRPPRNLVVCLDGTAGEVRHKKKDSNVVRLYGMLDLSDPAKQVAYYDPGVGTFAAPSAWTPIARVLSRLGGLVWGGGLRQNVGEAYTWLIREYRPGDRVFVFGFSRGAFTARALTGMIHRVGILRPGAENLVSYVVAQYARRGGEKKIDWKPLDRYGQLFSHVVNDTKSVPVQYLGVWDTVKAMGIARQAPRWPYTRSTPNARRIRHAVSIDETRRPFVEYLSTPDPKRTRLEEVWFAGVHCDVGGTYPDDARLSTIALDWMVRGAVEEGLLVRSRVVGYVRRQMAETDAAATAHRNGWIWALVVPRRRPVPEGAAVHASVRERMASVPGYRPRLPASVEWVDEGWVPSR